MLEIMESLYIYVVFLLLVLLEKDTYYWFHIVGMLLVNGIEYVGRLPFNVVRSIFTCVFGYLSVAIFQHTSIYYIITLLVVHIHLGLKIWYDLSFWNSLPMLIAIGATLSISYVFILQLFGFDLKDEDKNGDQKKKGTDNGNICVIYKNGEFSAFV